MIRRGLCLCTAFLSLAAWNYGETLELEDCRISAGPSFPSMRARCGTLERNLDPDDPASPSIELRVVVVPAINLKPEPDPVVPIAGGPGQGSVEFYAGWANAFGHLRRDRDILLVDQRGTGGSARLDCPFDPDLVAGDYSHARTIADTRECLAGLPYDPKYFTTSIAVRDLEAVRQALGYPALNLYGVSYGSRVAQHFARRFPESTRTVVLDGVVPPQLPLGPDIAIEAQRAVDEIFARCNEDAACRKAFGDVAAHFSELRDRLDAEPVEVRLPNPVSGAFETMSFGRMEFAAAIRLLAYHPSTIALIPLVVDAAWQGNYVPLAAQYQLTVAELSDALALGMHNSVMCSEDVPYFDDRQIDEAALEASYIGPMQLESLEAMCSVWPVGPVDSGFREPLSTDIPVLLLSGTADPITPPAYADLAARSLKRAWLLTGQDQGHGQLAVGCMPKLIAEFVAERSLAEADTSCIEDSFIMPFFLDFAGPAP